jgi:hypothetical protein
VVLEIFNFVILSYFSGPKVVKNMISSDSPPRNLENTPKDQLFEVFDQSRGQKVVKFLDL